MPHTRSPGREEIRTWHRCPLPTSREEPLEVPIADASTPSAGRASCSAPALMTTLPVRIAVRNVATHAPAVDKMDVLSIMAWKPSALSRDEPLEVPIADASTPSAGRASRSAPALLPSTTMPRPRCANDPSTLASRDALHTGLSEPVLGHERTIPIAFHCSEVQLCFPRACTAPLLTVQVRRTSAYRASAPHHTRQTRDAPHLTRQSRTCERYAHSPSRHGHPFKVTLPRAAASPSAAHMLAAATPLPGTVRVDAPIACPCAQDQTGSCPRTQLRLRSCQWQSIVLCAEHRALRLPSPSQSPHPARQCHVRSLFSAMYAASVSRLTRPRLDIRCPISFERSTARIAATLACANDIPAHSLTWHRALCLPCSPRVSILGMVPCPLLCTPLLACHRTLYLARFATLGKAHCTLCLPRNPLDSWHGIVPSARRTDHSLLGS
jgi:hypothetical protein